MNLDSQELKARLSKSKEALAEAFHSANFNLLRASSENGVEDPRICMELAVEAHIEMCEALDVFEKELVSCLKYMQPVVDINK